jgi:hypothetical protein
MSGVAGILLRTVNIVMLIVLTHYATVLIDAGRPAAELIGAAVYVFVVTFLLEIITFRIAYYSGRKRSSYEEVSTNDDG